MSYNLFASTDEYTVVTEFTPKLPDAADYQSEEALENEFIDNLKNIGYEYLEINSADKLIKNLRIQLERLNNITFSDDEWQRFFSGYINNPNDGVVEKTRIIQEDYIKPLKRDDGSLVNIKLLEKSKINNNIVQVIHQYKTVTTKGHNRYDVTILVNGLPLVHCELKRRGVPIRTAFEQIKRYQKESFWGSLFEYIQVFVISNGTYTRYFSNTTREAVIKETNTKVSKAFEFTSRWTDQRNNPIDDLMDFSVTFLAKRTILKILTKYCVFTTEKALMVLRPYQIVAVERMLNKIAISNEYNMLSSPKAGGYLFHTTGSGKTLSSFIAAQQASQLEFIDKVLFVVDRKDLDAQTIQEYEKFQKGAVNGNSTTNELKRQLEDVDIKGNPHEYRIIVTTIQKLGNFVKGNKNHPVYNKHVVIIFDECHRSQFGELHKLISKAFKKYHMFGFTGTPIYAKNKANSKDKTALTTEQLFGDRLHTYTIVDAINDGNVLPFHIDYLNTFRVKKDIRDRKVEEIDKGKVPTEQERIVSNVSYILDNYNRKTRRRKSYVSKNKIMHGFNSLFACESIRMAIMYYDELKKQIEDRGSDLKIAMIYSYQPNGKEEQFDADNLEETQKEALKRAIDCYNKTFGTSFDVSSKEFYNYYLDLTKRIKNNEVDITIVVNMLLTGFDSPLTDVLWVDKNLEMHNLIQAFSRTNRILNSVKTCGEIVCFRNLKDNVDEALALYGDKDAGGVVILRSYSDYLNGYVGTDKQYHKGYKDVVKDLTKNFPLPINIVGEQKEKQFIRMFGALLRLRNILICFDEFINVDKSILSPRSIQDYQSTYVDLKERYANITSKEKEDIYDDIEFETDLVESFSINIDYILQLIKKYHKKNSKDLDIEAQINLAINSSPQLRSKKELILKFFEEFNIKDDDVGKSWLKFIDKNQRDDLFKIVEEEKLKEKETFEFMGVCLDNGYLKTDGVDINNILPPVSRFAKENNRNEIKERITVRLQEFFEKYN